MTKNIIMQEKTDSGLNELHPKTDATQVSCSVQGLQATDVNSGMTELFTSVSNGKILLASAITDKGIETSGTDSWAVMSENIGKIITILSPNKSEMTKSNPAASPNITLNSDKKYIAICTGGCHTPSSQQYIYVMTGIAIIQSGSITYQSCVLLQGGYTTQGSSYNFQILSSNMFSLNGNKLSASFSGIGTYQSYARGGIVLIPY